jgi:putative nucleotidyltransferase with HDIG domain
MLGEARWRAHGRNQRQVAPYVVVLTLLAIVAVTAVAAPPDRFGLLSVILGVAAVIAGWMVAGSRDGLSVSASFIVFVLAGVFLGARSAMIAAVLCELTAAIRLNTRTRVVLLANLPASVVPAIAAALVSAAIISGPSNSWRFYATVFLASALAITLSFALYVTLGRTLFPDLGKYELRTFVEDLPSTVLNVLLVVAGAGITVRLGNAGIAFALSAVFTFSYMAHLLERARHRSEQNAALSWGVLGGLIRALDTRDGRAARHAAAVAGFSRDMAEKVGMSQEEQEFAHTAGLLHDIGHFALSDRVAERGVTLTDQDWEAIERHPVLGAEMCKDLKMYGPVAEIILAHHERVDGRGYPNRLTEAEIPEIAKIIAVAEAYDTLTASDTYRTRMSSFEAIRELRRVSGSQLDARYVEILANLLSGEGVGYRHADDADFDTELDIVRRLREARSGKKSGRPVGLPGKNSGGTEGPPGKKSGRDMAGLSSS